MCSAAPICLHRNILGKKGHPLSRCRLLDTRFQEIVLKIDNPYFLSKISLKIIVQAIGGGSLSPPLGPRKSTEDAVTLTLSLRIYVLAPALASTFSAVNTFGSSSFVVSNFAGPRPRSVTLLAGPSFGQLRRFFVHLENTRLDIAAAPADDVLAPALGRSAVGEHINRAGGFRRRIAEDQLR